MQHAELRFSRICSSNFPGAALGSRPSASEDPGEWSLKDLIRAGLHALGFEIYRYPKGCEQLEAHLRLLVPSRGIDVLFDVGANRGQFAAQLQRIHPAIRIHSFEPHPAAYATLQARAANHPHWHVHAFGLGRSARRAELTCYATDAFSSVLPINSLGQQRFPTELRAISSVEIELRTLADVLERDLGGDCGNRPMLKLDTQGLDLDVLMGAGSWLDRFDVVVTEASLRPIYERAAPFRDIAYLLTARGFALSGFFPVSRASDLSIIEADAVFVRQ